MGSRPARDGGSPPASSLIPQLRHSRRGSLASISSVNQVDKEALSLALDQIHNTASQTETLTIFNEYTSPPSSSSGLDSKGIAGELQGGLSGLYSRFRASVGSVRDIGLVGSEDDVADKTLSRSLQSAVASPAPSTRHQYESKHMRNLSTASGVPGSDSAASGRHSPLSTVSTDAAINEPGRSSKQSTISLGNREVFGKPLSGFGAPLKPSPNTVTQNIQPTTIDPAFAEISLGAAKTPDPKMDSSLVSQDVVPSGFHEPEWNAQGEEKSAGPGTQASADAQRYEPSRTAGVNGENTKAKVQAMQSSYGNPGGDPKSFVNPLGGKDQQAHHKRPSQEESVYPFPQFGIDGTTETAHNGEKFSSEPDKNRGSPIVIAENSISPHDVFVESGKSDAKVSKSKTEPQIPYQYLQIPLRKSIASPPLSRTQSPNRSISRASSTDTNTDSLTGASQQQLPRQDMSHLINTPRSKSNLQLVARANLQRDPMTMHVFSQIKSKVLNKKYWMKDENARDCFYCGDSFSAFRRKHHCRICGQIFDAKCTSTLPGEHFGQSGSLRVCKPCESIVHGNDDSSEFSDDGSLALPAFRPRHGSTSASDALASPFPDPSPITAVASQRSPGQPDLSIPTMSIPATRKAGEKSKRKSTVLEIDSPRPLARPSSSRSLKSAIAIRPHAPGHRRHNSRHQFQRGFKTVTEESAPFHQDAVNNESNISRLPAFHDDNIIDPDLAPYLSDEGSSGDEQMSIMAALNGDALSRSHDNEKHALSGLLTSSKKGRSKVGDKNISGVLFANRDSDNQSLHSVRTANLPRSARRRNISVSGNIHMRPSPRSYKATIATPNLGTNLEESFSSSALAQITSLTTPNGDSRMIRSSSMRGAAAPAVELNDASLRHVRRLLHQLLEDSAISDVSSWEKALMPILLRATDDVNPDVHNGDDIDIRHYVKLKKIPGGRPGDTSYVSGLVFTKNLALKSMPRSISHPNILILTFALEYARHQQHFMSLEPVIRQEREFLQNLVNRIAALRPQLLLVERNISGLALQFLEQANISTAYNVKASVLEAVSRCCQTRIISSIDKLAIKPAQAGKCASFYLKTYLSGSRKKTYMFLSGCAKELGCTIVLRGDDNAMLAKMKRITEFMIYVVYNLKLETCLMRDEFALIPSSTEVGSISPISDSARHQVQTKNVKVHRNSNSDEYNCEPAADSAKAGLLDPKASDDPDLDKPKIGLPEEDSVPEDVPMPTFYGDMVEEHKTKILSASPFVKFMQPYLLMRAREQERRLAYLKRLRDQDVMEEQSVDEKTKLEKFDLIKPEMVHERLQHASRKVREVLHAVHDAEYDKALHNYQTQSRQWEIYISGNMNLFDPYAHQNIAALYSVVCTMTTVPCSGPDLLALGFYNEHETDTDFEADCTLGQYVEDLCLGANTVCTSNGCEKKMIEHHRQYVHGEAQLSVFVERYPCKLRGLQNTILMWSTCRICSKETQVIPMSENSWKYSFGKYLELSFWSRDLRARADVCSHDLHRDHLRYFGFKDMALRVHYDPITLLEIIVPRARITWKVENDLRFKNELFTKIEDRLNKFMFSVKARIKSINTESVVQEKTESCRQEVEKLSKRATDEHIFLVQKLREKYMDSKHYEIIPLNRAIRATQEKVAEWDNAFSEFDHDFFPSEKDIRRLADLQLKKIFLDRNDSASSLTSAEDVNLAVTPEEAMTEKNSGNDATALNPQTMQMSSEKAHDMLASVVEKHVSTDGHPDEHQSAPATGPPIASTEPAQASIEAVQREDVRHLDLAVSSDLAEKLREEQLPPSIDPLALATPAGMAFTNTGLSEPSPCSNPSMLSRQNTNVPSDEQNSDSTKTLEHAHASGIPRPVEVNYRITKSNVSPTLSRTQSQPAHIRHDTLKIGSTSQSSTIIPHVPGSEEMKATDDNAPIPSIANHAKPADKKLSDRLGLGAIRPSGVHAHSMIPRSIASRRKDSKVSNLAKHFEQLSREFEKERIRDRRQRAEKSRRSRVHPMAASKPIVQVYRNVHEAVEEKEPSDEDIMCSDPSHLDLEESIASSSAMAANQQYQTPGDGFHAEETPAGDSKADAKNTDESRIGSDVEGEEGVRSDEDHSTLDDIQIPGTMGDQHAFLSDETQLDLKLDLPKHEKSSLMKMLTNFWAERSASGWQPLEYPLNTTDHIFADSDIIVREDEPSSLISFALDSEDYQAKLHSISEDIRASKGQDGDTHPKDSFLSDDEQSSVEESLLRPTGTHLKYQFSEGSARMLCKVFYAEQFDALRRKCGVSERFVESLSRCMKWDSKGGKTKSVFLKTLDDRFVLKSLSTIETQAFLRFAPAYFRIMSESLFHELPSVIAKMLGFYQIIIKNPVSGVEFNWFLLVMENLFYDRSPTRIFDLKGSMRNRRIQSTGEQNEVLLDENMVEFIYESPLFSREHSKKLLRASVWNDTLFLSRQNVMDYSLMIAIDENRKELVVGIIDCIRTYTWDKKLESWIKDRGKNRPTVTSPKEYKSRFREAMGRYVLQAPNCWHQFKAQQVETKLDDPGDEQAVQVVGL